MATVYKTPGVYVEEIPKFPPSIAPVETAIPAFIGYTEKAIRNGEDMTLKPVRVESIAEYEQIFGGAPRQDVTVVLDTNDRFVNATGDAQLFVFDSLRMFYANGGGNCFVVSVGPYPALASSINQPDIDNGLNALRNEDEPTIILTPDAVSLSGGPYPVQQNALTQCNDLQDRVAVFDLTNDNDFGTAVSNFRDSIGINHLKYGMAYGPWIQTTLPRKIWHENLTIQREGTGTVIPLEGLTTDANIQALIRDIKLSEDAMTALKGDATHAAGASKIIFDALGSIAKTLPDVVQKGLDGYKALPGTADESTISPAIQKLTGFSVALFKIIQGVNSPSPSYPSGTKFTISTSIANYLSANPGVATAFATLMAHHNRVKSDTAPTAPATTPISVAVFDTGATAATDLATVGSLLQLTFTIATGTFSGAALTSAITTAVTNAHTAVGVTTPKQHADLARDAAYAVAESALAMFNSVVGSTDDFKDTLNSALLSSFGTFKTLTTKGAEALNLLPPSGAIAGIYASVDRDRGVWKAPANVSLNAVTSPAVKISDKQQEEFNVDPNAGKSINIIRSFLGKGTLVWGARTLAGNDNEWRYVSVRRFFNFVEESTKKATMQFVFEPNDANTWVKVQGMIENFLTTLWRQGALQGIKPEHAFYVAVGIGKTMTALDILEGRMIVEIGMAVVRPAEFIILRFSHKMPES